MITNTKGKVTYKGGFLGRLFTQAHEFFPILTTSINDSQVIDSEDEEQNLINSIKNSIREWENANINFESAGEDELIDYYAYQIKAAEVKYQYLLRLIKEKGINTDKLCLSCLTTRVR